MHAESSLAKKISNLQEIQIITIACQKSNIALLIDLSNDLLLELSKHLSLLVSKDTDESIEDSLNSSADIYRMNLENCVVQIIFAKLKSKNSRQNMLALIALTNMISIYFYITLIIIMTPFKNTVILMLFFIKILNTFM